VTKPAAIPVAQALRLAKHALCDINYLLVEGFDQTWRTTTIEGVMDTVQELAAFIRKHDRTWKLPN
jgi:hypothetical protein